MSARGCKGSGIRPLRSDCWNIRHSNAYWRGWRTNCPVCGKVCAVTPAGRQIQKHNATKSKAKRKKVADQRIEKQALRDMLYSTIYNAGLKGISTRPDGVSCDLRETWEMAYLDGLADGGHTMKIGAFKRWLAKN